MSSTENYDNSNHSAQQELPHSAPLMGHADDVRAQLDAFESQERALAVEQFELDCKRHDLEARRRQVGDVRASLAIDLEAQGDVLSTGETLQIEQNHDPAKASLCTSVGFSAFGAHQPFHTE